LSSQIPVTAFPTAEESLALQVGLLDGDPAVEAWRKLSSVWRPDVAGLGWMAPLLMANLRRLVPDDPWVIENPHFLTLCQLKTGALTEFAQRSLVALERGEVPTLALKGLALGATVYSSPELRTLSDLDILVPRKDLFRAMAVLESSGFKSAPGAPSTPADLRRNHAHVFFSPRRHEPLIDLHWHVLASARADEDDALFWKEARPLRVGKADSLGLCAEDQLLHVLLHGVRWTRVPHVRWVADAVMILRASGPQFRTERFVEMARRYDAVTPAREGLSFVVGLIGEGRSLLDALLGQKDSEFLARAFKARATAYEDRTVADRLYLRLEDIRWWARSAGVLKLRRTKET